MGWNDHFKLVFKVKKSPKIMIGVWLSCSNLLRIADKIMIDIEIAGSLLGFLLFPKRFFRGIVGETSFSLSAKKPTL